MILHPKFADGSCKTRLRIIKQLLDINRPYLRLANLLHATVCQSNTEGF